MPKLTLTGDCLTIDSVAKFLDGEYAPVNVSKEARAAVRKGRAFVEKLLKSDKPVYGVNTGFGKMANVRIDADKLGELQLNLIRSHSCGVAEPLPENTTRLAMLLRINSLVHGNSGVREQVIDALLALLNSDVVPWVPRKGSVGASGDLAPLSHIALVLLGEGKAYFQGKLMAGGEALNKAGLDRKSVV